MADKYLSVPIGGKLAKDVTIADSAAGGATVELRVPLGTSDPALSRQDLLNAFDAIEMALVQAPFPVA